MTTITPSPAVTTYELHSLAISQTPAQSLVRIELYEGREHLVFPVVLLVGDTVIEPLGSTGPEYIPGDILSLGSSSWDGRPIVYDHPMANDGRRGRSANNHAILASRKIGHLSDTYVENNTLKSTAWIDLELVQKVEGAGEIVTHIMSGGVIEGSIGAWSRYNPTSGTHNGQSYHMSWADAIIPDHYALLPIGRTGACSVEMGCGGPRINSSNNIEEPSMAVDVNANVSVIDPDSDSFWAKAAAAITRVIAAGVPTVTAPTNDLTIIAASADGAGGCSCGGHSHNAPPASLTSTVTNEVTPNMPTNAAVIARLRAQLPTATDAQLEELAAGIATDLSAQPVATTPPAKPEAPAPVPAPSPVPTPPAPTPLTEDQLIAAASQPLRDLIADAKARDAADRAIALKALEGVIAQGTFTAAELGNKPTRELRALASLVKPATRFELQGVPVDHTIPKVAPYPKAPDAWGLNKSA